MEISDENLQTLARYLQETLNPDVNIRRPGKLKEFSFEKSFQNAFFVAEKFLEGVEVNQNYPLLLLNLVHKPEIEMTIRIAGAIAFKNYIKRNWPVVSGKRIYK